MPESTDQPPEQPSPTQPQPSSVLAEPATVEACAQDYADGADVRHTMDQQQARGRH